MAADKYTRSKDYSDEANNNAGGRDTVDPAGLDGEMDEIASVTDDHADKLDLLLRDDLLMVANILQGHEFSPAALTVLGALLGFAGFLNDKGVWVTATDYVGGDLAYDSGSTYLCLVDHTSGAFATDLAAAKWRIFAAAGSSGLPALVANKVLSNNGVLSDWRYITSTEAPTLAPLADATLTGVTGIEDVNISGRFNLTAEAVAFVAGGNAFDFDTKFLKTVDVTGNYTGACSVSNTTQGDLMEVHFDNTSGSDAALLWDADWVWMGYAPDTLPAGKKAVLSLRAPTGAAGTDIIAMWSVEP